jgi:hypothetical protein
MANDSCYVLSERTSKPINELFTTGVGGAGVGGTGVGGYDVFQIVMLARSVCSITFGVGGAGVGGFGVG